MNTVEAGLTALLRALWIVDNAVAKLVEPDPDNPTSPITRLVMVTELLHDSSRHSNRGKKKRGLTPRLYQALMIAAAMQGKVTVKRMHEIATGQLPRELKWELGILTVGPNGKPQELTRKQLYNMGEALNLHLGWLGPKFAELDDDEQARRQRTLIAIADALTVATHVVERVGNDYAVDETGIWAWSIGRKKPTGTPPVHPADEDEKLAEKARTEDERAQKAGKDILDNDTLDDDLVPDPPDEDDPMDDDESTDATAIPDAATAVAGDPDETDDADRPTKDCAEDSTKERRWCRYANWGVKTRKDGARSSYYGYSGHVIGRVPRLLNGASDVNSEPLLIERFRVTSASSDVVDVTLGMIDDITAGGQAIGSLLGDRHYSYKKFERWAKELWRRHIYQVLDLREGDHGARLHSEMKIIAGTPHCKYTPDHLDRIERPGRNASKEDKATFKERIALRQRYASQRHGTVLGDGKSRWICSVVAGCAGCPFVEGSVTVAKELGLPIVVPTGPRTKLCGGGTVQVQPGIHMKHAQEEYWGSDKWEASWNRRTYIESIFGRMKNPFTGNMTRGFFCFTGLPLVTMAIAAAVVAYNIRELNDWTTRSGSTVLVGHPLTATTEHVYGFTMLNKDEQNELDQQHMPDAA